MLWIATDRVLIAHRNLKLWMYLISGPFFILLFLFKYSIKFSVLYFMYKKKNTSETAVSDSQAEESKPLQSEPAKANTSSK